MPKGKKLTDIEVGKVLGLHEAGKSNRNIAKIIGRSEKAVRTVLLNAKHPKARKKVGRKVILKKCHLRRIFRLACIKQQSCREIEKSLGFIVHKSCSHSVLRASKFAKYIKRKPSPYLKKQHKVARLRFAKQYINKPNFWHCLVFSDEKMFNLDGPDGCQYYWHDLRREPETYSKRVVGGGSVMVWAAICSQGKSKLAILQGKQDSSKYCETLSNYLLPFLRELEEKHGIKEPVFQHDNASIHSSRATAEFLANSNCLPLIWPSKSPDLNVIENVWGVLARDVYKNGRQFATKDQLEA
ncbi:hypothetical protein Ae201684P_006988 [Aphanomyces euteiches]|uniref:Tc1-like transposase DDE domain-containing protein n=1 Tax=Aphanomyces euteiches TaxID=100861 RepID=A0A6G0X8C8_9STRA|nr:hypothetical protein Ae201684_007281 [Aphanomyces euteiches]KAH9100794.1 hypothetical protein Ae201684P_006988 [Aphanomyces euteiches]